MRLEPANGARTHCDPPTDPYAAVILLCRRLPQRYSSLQFKTELFVGGAMGLIQQINTLPVRLRRVTASGAYRPEIDGLRFFAIAYVILWHLYERIIRLVASARPLSSAELALPRYVPWPTTGVCLFFSISGFILATQFLRNFKEFNKESLGLYFYRRITRIEPPYIILLLATYLILVGTGYEPKFANNFYKGPSSLTSSLIASLLYSHAWFYNALPRLFSGAWSLEIEVQFYTLAPFLFYAYFKIQNTPLRLLVGAAILLALCATSATLGDLWPNAGFYRYTLLKYGYYFWLGTLLADANSRQLFERIKLPAPAWDALALIGFAAITAFSTSVVRKAFPVGTFALDLIFVLGMTGLYLGAIRGRAFRAFCAAPWISLIGGACYSIYLTHVQILLVITEIIDRIHPVSNIWLAVACGVFIEAPIALAGGLFFYMLIERPFMYSDWPGKVRDFVAKRMGSRVNP